MQSTRLTMGRRVAQNKTIRTKLGGPPLADCDAIYHPKNLQCLKVPPITNLTLFYTAATRLQIHPHFIRKQLSPRITADWQVFAYSRT